MSVHTLFVTLDILGVFVFAISGAAAALQNRLDLFGVVVVAFVTACGGGLIRDLCIGAIPPAGLSNWIYLAAAIAAALTTVCAYGFVERLAYPVLLFDAAGLGLFAITGSHKALQYGHNTELAILLGMITAVGGGVGRDVLLNRVPVILQKEIYASAALVGSSIEVLGEGFGWSTTWLPWVAMLMCFALRIMALKYGWHMRWFAMPHD
ncbi:trimeric intracellular cation channel family protein [Pseudomonas defluvii]|uniref:trimeric intracellular cation channel family protein n=1 Tax=Pseudomonas defluvii TaxID=1876757 RepID=UPI003906A3DB